MMKNIHATKIRIVFLFGTGQKDHVRNRIFIRIGNAEALLIQVIPRCNIPGQQHIATAVLFITEAEGFIGRQEFRFIGVGRQPQLAHQ